MKEDIMNIKLVRTQARQLQLQHPMVFSYFALPTFLTIFASYILTGTDITELLTQMELREAVLFLLSRQIFPSIIGFILSFLYLGATFRYLISASSKGEKSFGIFTIFQNQYFTPVFLTLFIKQLILSFWGSLLYVSQLLLTVVSSQVLAIKESIPSTATLTTDTPEVQAILKLAPTMTTGLLMSLVGLLLFLPFYYQYSLVELILYSRLMTGTYDGPLSILRQSREEMKGFKSHRLVLDLSLLGWQILSFFSLGVADFYVKPYTTSCQIIFYHTLLQTRMQVTGCFRQNAPDSPDSDPLA